MLRACGWGMVCEVNEIVFIHLVMQFYANLKLVGDHDESIVNNKYFAFDSCETNELFGMLSEGNEFCKPKTPSPILLIMMI